MKNILKNTALALAASGLAATAIPAAAADFGHGGYHAAPHEDSWNKHRNRDRYDRDRYRRSYDDNYYSRSGNYYGEPVYRNTQVWRGQDGRTYCRKKDGTTGLIIGAAAGALIGRSVSGYGDRTLGTVIGGALGALLGKQVAQNTGNSRCR